MSVSHDITPKVFMSYSWSSPEHQQSVIHLATRLRNDGVDVLLDVWDLKEGQDKYSFMEKLVLDASVSKVLMIIDKQYAEKANNRTGGVGTETQIISSELYNKVDQVKFIPLVLEYENNEPILPTFIKSLKYVDLSGSNGVDNYEYLVRLLYNKPLYEKPALGTPPKFLSTAKIAKTSFLSEAYNFQKAVLTGSPNNIQSSAKKVFRDLSKEVSESAIIKFQTDFHDDEIVESINDLKVVQEKFADIISELIDFDPNLVLISIREYFEPLLKAYVPQSNQYKSYQNDNIIFYSQESLIIASALLVKAEAFKIFSDFTDSNLLIKKNYQSTNGTVLNLYKYVQSIDSIRNQRLVMNRVSVTADFLKERVPLKHLSFEDLISGDLFLFLRGLFTSQHWTPRTVVYLNEYDTTEVFIRAESNKYLEHLVEAFDFKNPSSFKTKFEELRTSRSLSDWRISSNSWPLNFLSILNYQKLGTIK